MVPAIFTAPLKPPHLIVIVIVPTAAVKSKKVGCVMEEIFHSNFTVPPPAQTPLPPAACACGEAGEATIVEAREGKRKRMLNFSWKCNKVTFYDRLGVFVSLRFTAPSSPRPIRSRSVRPTGQSTIR